LKKIGVYHFYAQTVTKKQENKKIPFLDQF